MRTVIQKIWRIFHFFKKPVEKTSAVLILQSYWEMKNSKRKAWKGNGESQHNQLEMDLI
jgi:hypothetical protein